MKGARGIRLPSQTIKYSNTWRAVNHANKSLGMRWSPNIEVRTTVHMHTTQTTPTNEKIRLFFDVATSLVKGGKRNDTIYFLCRQPRNPFLRPSSPDSTPFDNACGRCASISGSSRWPSSKHLAQNSSGSSWPLSASQCLHCRVASSEQTQHHEDDACLGCCCRCSASSFRGGLLLLRSKRVSSIACRAISPADGPALTPVFLPPPAGKASGRPVGASGSQFSPCGSCSGLDALSVSPWPSSRTRSDTCAERQWHGWQATNGLVKACRST